jgi:hypothetical protein
VLAAHQLPIQDPVGARVHIDRMSGIQRAAVGGIYIKVGHGQLACRVEFEAFYFDDEVLSGTKVMVK